MPWAPPGTASLDLVAPGPALPVAPEEAEASFSELESAGFTAGMCSDHFAPWSARQGQSGFAWSFMGALGLRTSLRFGTAVTCPGFRYHPAVVAQKAATIGLLSDGPMLTVGSQVLAPGGTVPGPSDGHVTSAVFSPTLGRPIAMGYVATAHAALGTFLKLEQRGKLFQAQVVPMPFVPHQYHRKPAGA